MKRDLPASSIAAAGLSPEWLLEIAAIAVA